MPSWCMFCGDAKMPDTGISLKRGRKGLKWKKPSRVALRWKRITVCWECYKKVTCEKCGVTYESIFLYVTLWSVSSPRFYI